MSERNCKLIRLSISLIFTKLLLLMFKNIKLVQLEIVLSEQI